VKVGVIDTEWGTIWLRDGGAAVFAVEGFGK